MTDGTDRSNSVSAIGTKAIIDRDHRGTIEHNWVTQIKHVW